MIVRIDPDYLEHASKSKYKGGFTKDGKNTSAYNHDYYIHNKEKWKDNDDSGDLEEWDRISRMEDGEAKTRAIENYYLKQHPQNTPVDSKKSHDRITKVGSNYDNDLKSDRKASSVRWDQRKPERSNKRERNDSGKSASVSVDVEKSYKENRAPVQEIVGPGRKRNDSGKSASVKGGSKNKTGPDWKVYPEGADPYDPMFWDVVAPPKKRRKGKKPIGHVVLK